MDGDTNGGDVSTVALKCKSHRQIIQHKKIEDPNGNKKKANQILEIKTKISESKT